MPGGSGIEPVGGQKFLSREQLGAGAWSDEVEIAGFAANRAIAVHHFQNRRRQDFKTDAAAMTAAAMCRPCHLATASVIPLRPFTFCDHTRFGSAVACGVSGWLC